MSVTAADGQGDDVGEEIQIGGTVAGVSTKQGTVSTTTQQAMTVGQVGYVPVQSMAMGVAVDPTTGQQFATPMVYTDYMPVVSYQTYITT